MNSLFVSFANQKCCFTQQFYISQSSAHGIMPVQFIFVYIVLHHVACTLLFSFILMVTECPWYGTYSRTNVVKSADVITWHCLGTFVSDLLLTASFSFPFLSNFSFLPEFKWMCLNKSHALLLFLSVDYFSISLHSMPLSFHLFKSSRL